MAEEIKEKVEAEVVEEKVETSKEEVETETKKPLHKEKKDKSKEQIMKLEEQLKIQHNEYLKVYAEMENTKKRLKEEAIKDRKYASQKVVGELVGPIDMLQRIVNSEAPSPEIASYLIGFKMIAGQLIDILKNEGLSEIEALNKEFDPKLMQAVSVSENDSLPDNVVVEVMQTGYMYKDRVLRPAMVNVNKHKQEENKEEE